jgi:transposase, IS5 family
LIRRWTVTDASRHDGALLPQLIDTDNTAGKVRADTAYRSKANERFLAGRLMRSQIHQKKPKGRAMPRRTAHANARKSAVRSAVEHVFARQKGPMGLFIRTSALPEPKPRSASPTSSTICSKWSGSPPAPQRHDPLNRPPE